jgi:hypothetical protein
MNHRTRISANLILAACFAVAPAFAEGSPWFLDGCDASYQRKADHLRQEMLKAQPGSDVYVPKPFPRTNADVVSDFKEQVRSTFSPQPGEKAPPAIGDLLARLDAGKVRFEVVPVVEWRPERCRSKWGKTDRSFLLRLYDSATGRELSRASIVENGLLSVVGAPGADGKLGMRDHDIETLDAAKGVANQLGLPATGFQYVSMASPSILCQETAPCIAFRASGIAYLYRSGKLFQLVIDRPGVAGHTTIELMREGAARRSAAATLHGGEHFVTVGANHIAVAVPVPLPQ